MHKKILLKKIFLGIVFALILFLVSCNEVQYDYEENNKTDSTNYLLDSNEKTDEVSTYIDNIVAFPDVGIEDPVIIVDNVSAHLGDKRIAVRIFVKNNPGLSSIAVTLDFDRSSLKLVDYEYNTQIGGQYVEYNATVTTPKLIWLNWSDEVKGDWVFATLYFDVSDRAIPGESFISLSYDADDIYNFEEENVYFKVVNGAVTIKER